MKQAAITRKPSLPDKAALLEFATQEAPQAPSKSQATGRAGKDSKGSQKAIKGLSGQVPAGCVRLNANVRADLHYKIKMEAAKRQMEKGSSVTIGDLIEELIEKHL